jgi:hypothetical protein
MTAPLPTIPAAWAASPWTARLEEAGPFAAAAAPWLALIAVVVAAMTLLASRRGPGKRAARTLRKLAAALLDPGTYRQFHDVSFQTRQGEVHIDLLLVSPFGVFVVDCRDEAGEIDGKAFDAEWTRTFRGVPATFPNPLRPNFERKLALGGLLGLDGDRLFSVVAFTDGASFRHPMPDNVTRGKGLADYVASRDTALMSESDVAAVLARTAEAMARRPAAPGRTPGRTRSAGKSSRSPLRFMNALKFAAMAAALAGGAHVFHNTTQYPDIPFNPVGWLTGETPSKAEITSRQPLRTEKTPRSDAYGILKISARKSTSLTLADEQSGETVLNLDLKPGETREIELRKGRYTARILQDGAVRTRLVSFIGSTGALEL